MNTWLGVWFHNDNSLNAVATGQSQWLLQSQLYRPVENPRSVSALRTRRDSLWWATYSHSLRRRRKVFSSGKDTHLLLCLSAALVGSTRGSGFTINGAPNEAGRQALRLAQVIGAGPLLCLDSFQLRRTLHRHCGPVRPLTLPANGQTFTVPKGSLTGSSSIALNDWQQSIRIDHNLTKNHTLNGRYIYQDQDGIGSTTGQSTPPGHNHNFLTRSQAVNLTLNSVLTPTVINEFRGAYLRTQNGSSHRIQVRGYSIDRDHGPRANAFNAAANRTAHRVGREFPAVCHETPFRSG